MANRFLLSLHKYILPASSISGVYTAPVDGLYLFYTKVGAFSNGQDPSDDNPIGTPYNAEININFDGTDIANSNSFDGWDYIRYEPVTGYL